MSGTRTRRIALQDGDQIVLCENIASRKSIARRGVLLIHGLGGGADSPYMIRTGSILQRRGWSVFRMNHRGCGEGRGLARKTYHSGKSDDIDRVVKNLTERYPGQPLIVVGFSLSGNAVLKYLGEQKDAVPEELMGAIAVTPPIMLSRCATEMQKLRNRMYQCRFVGLLRTAVAERRDSFPDFPTFHLRSNMSIRDFDEICTAPLHGFASAEDYYRQCSAKQFLPEITTPTVLLASLDDPFIPRSTFDELPRNDNIAYYLTPHGGHMGYIARKRTPLKTHRWLEYAIQALAESFVRRSKSSS